MANVIYESSRGYDTIRIEDDFLKNREIFLTEEVNAATMGDIIKQVMYLDNDDNTKEITLYINSPGGSVDSGLALYDVLMHIKSPVRTVCIGLAASMGALLFLAGDRREMMEHGKVMIHDPFYGNADMSGKKPHEIQQQLNNLNETKEAVAKIIAERCNKDIQEVYRLTATDTYFNVQDALKFGIATNELGDFRERG